jgi:glycosyltransferase involved in cell wall biosynthesis
MARAVLSVLQDPRERARLAIAARALIERDYSWASTLAAFDAALAGLHARDADG